MADRTRLAAAGLFLALTLAAVPALLPLNLAGANTGQPVEAATVVPPLVHLRGGELATSPARDDAPAAPEGVLRFALAAAAPRAHTVAPGETLWRISEDAGVGVEALAAANHLTVGAILHPGQMLTIPPLDPGSAPARPATHEVAAGETLWAISRASGIRVETLAAANHLAPDAVLHPGQTLLVPAQDGPASAAHRPANGRARAPQMSSRDRTAPVYRVLLAANLGSLAQPSEGFVTSRFGWRVHPIFGTREFHTGLDIANRVGTPVRAAENGIVRFVGWMAGYGRLVVVAHGNGLETSYSHLSAMLVALGQRVTRGQVLGRMGSTGWSTGPHLFFEVRRNGVPVDPIPFLQGRGGAAAVLLPGPTVRPGPAGQASVPPPSSQSSAGQAAAPPSSTPAPSAQPGEHRTETGAPPDVPQ